MADTVVRAQCGCHQQGSICPNTCGCCTQHVAPEIKLTPQEQQCACCHLDSCGEELFCVRVSIPNHVFSSGCCQKETIVPEEKEIHVAPEICDQPACPCDAMQTSTCPCASH